MINRQWPTLFLIGFAIGFSPVMLLVLIAILVRLL